MDDRNGTNWLTMLYLYNSRPLNLATIDKFGKSVLELFMHQFVITIMERSKNYNTQDTKVIPILK